QPGLFANWPLSSSFEALHVRRLDLTPCCGPIALNAPTVIDGKSTDKEDWTILGSGISPGRCRGLRHFGSVGRANCQIERGPLSYPSIARDSCRSRGRLRVFRRQFLPPWRIRHRQTENVMPLRTRRLSSLFRG